MVDAFVGRRGEIGQLEAALDDTCAGRGRIALLAGEPGIGKTSTLSELASRARARNARVFAGRCYEGDGAPAYWPWVQVIRACIADRAPAALRAALGNGAADVAQLVPEIREHLADLPVPAPLPPDQARFALFDAVAIFLKKLAADQPLVLVLDDLHRADPPSLLLLHFVAREIGEASLFLLGTYRDGEIGADHPLAALLAELHREPHYTAIPLRGLPDEDVRALVASLGGDGVSDAVLRSIARQTEGNPFFVKEMWRHLVQEGLVERDGDGWHSRLRGEGLGVPAGVRQVIGRRIARRSEAAQQALAMAAVFGREFHADVLQRFAEIEEEALFAVLDEAAEAQLIEEHRGPSGPGYRFSHALIQETLYDALTSGRKRRLHRQAGEALEQARSGRLEPHYAALAHHFVRAGEIAKAIEYSHRAGDAAHRIYAWEQAIQRWTVALELIEAHGGALAERTALVHKLDDLTHRTAIDWEKGIRLLERELAARERMGDRAEAAAIHARLGLRHVVLNGQPTLDLRKGFAHLERARAILEEDDPESPHLADVYFSLSLGSTWAFDTERGAACARRCLELSERVDSGRASAFAWTPRAATSFAMVPAGYYLVFAGRLREGFELLEQAWAIGDELDDALAAQFAAYTRGLFELLSRRDPAQARVWSERELEKPRQAAPSWPRGQLLGLLGQAQIWTGRMDEARALRRSAESFPPVLQATLGGFFLELLIADGEWDAFEDAARAALGKSRADGFDWFTWDLAQNLGALCLRRGEHERAEEYLRICVQLEERERLHGFMGMSARVLLAQLFVRTHRLKEARREVEFCSEVLARGEDWGGSVGRAALARGSLLAAEGRWGEAEATLEHALGVARKFGLPWDEADALHERARFHLARGGDGDRAHASRWLDAAIAIYDRLGARRHRELAAAEVPVVPELPAIVPAHPSVLHANLFRQEGEYWTIAYQGALIRVRDSRGLRYIACLIEYAGREFHVADLAQSIRRANEAEAAAREGDGGEILDMQARTEYRERIAELRAELQEATELGDLGRAESAREELDLVSEALTAAYGLGGRARKAADPIERLRKAVSNRIRVSIAKIRAQDAALGLHLANAIRTGVACSYAPERPVAWIVEASSRDGP